jgi:hypothetical protein
MRLGLLIPGSPRAPEIIVVSHNFIISHDKAFSSTALTTHPMMDHAEYLFRRIALSGSLTPAVAEHDASFTTDSLVKLASKVTNHYDSTFKRVVLYTNRTVLRDVNADVASMRWACKLIIDRLDLLRAPITAANALYLLNHYILHPPLRWRQSGVHSQDWW